MHMIARPPTNQDIENWKTMRGTRYLISPLAVPGTGIDPKADGSGRGGTVLAGHSHTVL